MLLPEPAYLAVICLECQRASLAPDHDSESLACATCGAGALQVPGAKFVAKDLPLFSQLERIVYDAKLSHSEATLIAAELESVGLRWEPPDMVLRHISTRLNGLQAAYDARQDYSRLLLIAGMLLTIVCARMIGSTSAPTRSSRSSGVRRAVVNPTPEQAAVLRRRAASQR